MGCRSFRGTGELFLLEWGNYIAENYDWPSPDFIDTTL